MPLVTPLRPEDPRRIGRYRLTGRIDGLAADGEAGVFLARKADGEAVMVTVLGEDRAKDAAARDRFAAEARVARRVPPFCAARILDAGFEGRWPYLVTEFVPGPSLAEVMRKEGPLPASTLLAVAAGCATGLAAIHQAGLVHGDFRPETVVLSPDGPRVVHFSVTPPYGAATPAADMLAWGQAVTRAGLGRAPTARQDLAALPAGLRGVVDACLGLDPAARPPARDVLTALLRGRDLAAGLLAEGSRLGQGAARAAGSTALPPEPQPRRQRRPAAVLWVLACAACLLAAAGAAAYIASQPGSSPQVTITLTPAASQPPATRARHTASPPPPTKQVPQGMAGTWTGTVRQTKPALSVSVQISLTGGGRGGTVSYPQLGCSGSLTVITGGSARIILAQKISTGRASCADGRITLRAQGGKLAYVFARPGGGSPAGVLTRVFGQAGG
jgi:eukaryotic-like serine/threonine-protein kinase